MKKNFIIQLMTSLILLSGIIHNGFAQTNAYQKQERCMESINQKYTSVKEKMRGKYYYTKPYKGVALAHECWSGDEICIKHNSRICCACEALLRKEYQNIEDQRNIALQKCREQYESESKNEQEKAEQERLREEQEKESKNGKSTDQKRENKSPISDKNTTKNNRDKNTSESPQIAHTRYVGQRRQTSSLDAQRAANDNVAYMTSILSNPDFMDGSNFVDSHFGFNLSMSVIGVSSLPIYSNIQTYSYSNNISSHYSMTDNSSTIYGPFLSAELYAFNTSNFHIKGNLNFFNAWSKLGGLIDRNDSMSEFSSGGEIGLGLGRFKLLGSYMDGYRNLSMSSFMHIDATQTDFTTDGVANYRFKRYGGGLKFSFDSDNSGEPVEQFLEIKFYQEKNDFSDLKLTGYAIKGRFWIDLGVEYFPKYPTAGIPAYQLNDNSGKSMWSITLSKTMTFFKGRYY